MNKDSTAWKVLKAVLNLPEPGEIQSKRKKKPSETSSSQSTGAWDNVLASASTPKEPAHEDIAEPKTSPLWQSASVRAGGKDSGLTLKKLMRWAAIFILALFTWIGLRTAIWGDTGESHQQAEVPLTIQYPKEQAAGIAQRFTTAYLTFSEGEEDERAAALSPYYSGGEANGKLGWDGKGKQSADNAVVLSVEPIDKEKSRVVVLADVTPYANGKATTSHPVALEVSVSVNEKGAAVYGNPAYVGIPVAPEVLAGEPQALDSELTQQTKEAAEEFFTAYAANDTLDSLTAPGAHITGLNGAVKNPTLTRWNVGSGSDNERPAWATVTYQTNGSTVTNTYQLMLVKVSGGESAKWQIKEIKGSEN